MDHSPKKVEFDVPIMIQSNESTLIVEVVLEEESTKEGEVSTQELPHQYKSIAVTKQKRNIRKCACLKILHPLYLQIMISLPLILKLFIILMLKIGKW